MKNSNSFRPTQNEINSVSAESRRDARRGTLIGGLGGAVVGSLVAKKKLAGRLAGAAAGGITGHVVGREVGRREGAKDVVKSRGALLRQMARRLDAKLTELESRISGNDKFGNVLQGPLSGQDKNPFYKHRSDVGEVGNGIDAQGDYNLTETRQALADEFGWGVINSLPDEMLTRENCEALRAALMARADSANGYGPSEAQFERHYLSSKLGERAVASMGNAEVHAIYLSHARRGLVELADDRATTDFAIDMRNRTPQGEFAPGGGPSASSIQRAYNPNPRDRATGKNVGIGAGAAAAGLGAAVLAAKKFRKGKLPKLTTSGKVVDVSASPVKSFARRNMTASPFPGGPKKLIRRMRRNRRNFALLIHDPDFPIVPMKKPKKIPGLYTRVTPAQTKGEVIERLRKLTEWSRLRQKAIQFDGAPVGKWAAESLIDTLGLGGATQNSKKRLRRDAQGNIISPSWLGNGGDASIARPALAADDQDAPSQFSIGSIAGKFGPDAAVIAGADLTAEELHDAIQTAKKKKKQKALVNGGIEQESGVPGNSPSTLSAIHGTLLEFEHGNERLDRARRNGTTIAAAGVGGVAGAVGGLAHNQGKPVKHSDLKPGDRIYRRFGPGGLFQHTGIVGSDGRVTHRTSGSSIYRSVSPDTFRRTGKPPTYREESGDDLPRSQRAKNATKATGTRAGKYCVGSNNCQTAVERISSKGKPFSGQIRRAGIGALGGALAAGSAAAILNKRKNNQ